MRGTWLYPGRRLTWRERFLIACGPGVLAGITLGDWFQLLRDNRFAIDLAYVPRACAISLAAVVNSLFRWHEERQYAAKWSAVTVPAPLFVLGHWRSGTTYLHYLLGRDPRFVCPTFYQVIYPHTFLSTERRFSRLTSILLPRRRPYDNVALDLSVPCEDEFAMCISGFVSPYLAGVFPRRAAHYDQFLTMGEAQPQAVEAWKAALQLFLRKVVLQNDKPLVIKSPAHTARIKLLLDMFPDAKFVHIRRNPYAVFQSCVQTFETGLPFGCLQRTSIVDWTERIIRQYREVYDAYFADCRLIPAGRLHELNFEALEAEPTEELRRLYAALGLPNFAVAEPKVQCYVELLSSYRKNIFPDLAPTMRLRIAREWRRCFEEWGYPR